MYRQLARIALLIALVSLACNVPVFASPDKPQGLPRAVSKIIVKGGASGTRTLTPFQPVGPTRTVFPPTWTSTPDKTAVATREATTSTETIEPSPTNPPTAGITNLLVLGSDWRPNAGYRTDTIILVSINKNKGTVSAVSFPRDLYVEIPGWMTQRINTAQAHGGFSMMQDTMEYNFGVRPQYYIMTNFQGFKGIIDSVGGVDVNVGSYLSDTCDLPQGWGGWCTYNAGVHHMDGATALWYVRARHTTSDFERGRKAQEVMVALFTKLISLDGIKRFPELYKSYISSVETNMDLGTMLTLLPVASQVVADNSRLHQFRITPNEAYGYITPEGADVLLPNYEAIKAILNNAIYGQ